jgi:hypothetical protein
MFDVQTLLSLGMSNHLVSVWQVFLYIVVIMPFLLWHHTKICLLITYMFCYYLAFTVYWGNYLSESVSIGPFIIYIVSGLAIIALTIAASFYEQTKKDDSPQHEH